MTESRVPRQNLPLPAGRLLVLVIIEVVIVIVVAAGYAPQTAVAVAAGGGPAATRVARRLFGSPLAAGGRQR